MEYSGKAVTAQLSKSEIVYLLCFESKRRMRAQGLQPPAGKKRARTPARCFFSKPIKRVTSNASYLFGSVIVGISRATARGFIRIPFKFFFFFFSRARPPCVRLSLSAFPDPASASSSLWGRQRGRGSQAGTPQKHCRWGWG